MAKKNFKKGFDALLSEEMNNDFPEIPQKKPPPRTKVEINKSDDFVKVTYNIPAALHLAFKDQAYLQRRSMNELVISLIEKYIENNKNDT